MKRMGNYRDHSRLTLRWTGKAQMRSGPSGQFPITHRIGLRCDLRSSKSKDIWLTRLLMIDFLDQRNYLVQ